MSCGDVVMVLQPLMKESEQHNEHPDLIAARNMVRRDDVTALTAALTEADLTRIFSDTTGAPNMYEMWSACCVTS